QLSQVFMNLVLNAAQAMDDRGTITLRSGLRAQAVWIEIEDSGCGMSEEVQKRIFEPFYTSKPVGQGTGLGLSMSWEVVKRHGGTLTVSSQPGVGSTFRITLPQSPSLHA
ncbi:MAG: hypothetical protein K9K38_18175, partial [Rhodoferax sp.]|nr:hypothetical protein [Rhodoferax sp.]